MTEMLTTRNNWHFKSPVKGDHIRVNRLLYYHHGIYVSDSEVIHFNTHGHGDGLLGDATVIVSTLKEFLEFGRCEVRIYGWSLFEKTFPPEIVVERARSRIGESGYNIVFNNCEHFAHWCKTGIKRSSQIEDIVIKTVRKILKN
jgi:hypothetical protein